MSFHGRFSSHSKREARKCSVFSRALARFNPFLFSDNIRKQREHLQKLSLHNQRTPTISVANIRKHITAPNPADPSSINEKERESQQRQIVEQYLFSKLEVYGNKSRLWQLAHSQRIKRRLLDKSKYISEHYSIRDDFVQDSINQFFARIDKHVLQLHAWMHQVSQAPRTSNWFQRKATSSPNEWNLLQLQRAHQLFPDADTDSVTENELIENYRKHVFDLFTPKCDAEGRASNIEECRDAPFDLNEVYARAENKGKELLNDMLESFHGYGQPNLSTIQEMVRHGEQSDDFETYLYTIDLGLERMKSAPKKEEFDGATSFLSKVSLLFKMQQWYKIGLQNAGDDFMLLRFGKVLGPKALPTTAPSSEEFTYLLQLFLRSIFTLAVMMGTNDVEHDEDFQLISNIVTDMSNRDHHASLIQLPDDRLLSPKLNIDQWTWLLEKWRDALRTLPILLTEVGAFTRLLRTTIGIAIAHLYTFAERMIESKQPLDLTLMNEELFRSLQIGFYFGVAYAVVDCAQDEIRNVEQSALNHLGTFLLGKRTDERSFTAIELVDQWLGTMERVLSGEELDRKAIPKTPLTPLMIETFDSLVILTKQTNTTCSVFNELALLLRSQRMDQKTPNRFYNDVELYLGKTMFFYSSNSEEYD